MNDEQVTNKKAEEIKEEIWKLRKIELITDDELTKEVTMGYVKLLEWVLEK